MSFKTVISENNEPIKLNLGCGSTIREGYLNIDKYVSAPNIIQMDIFNLLFNSNSVDEIFTEHMLEHLNKYEVPRALKEWARVLKANGKLVMNLPNLEWCLHQWLEQPEEKRWGWQLDTIFGLQTHPGEFHKTGFTQSRLKHLLKVAGFRDIEIKDYWSHGQSCFWVEASKGYTTEVSNQLASIIVPWWDHSELLKLWDQNLQHLQNNVEIIFVDNGSEKKSKLALNNFCHQHDIHLIRNEENRGFSAANNQGIEVATGEYILHLNNDIEILKSPVEYLCQRSGEGLAGPGFMQNDLGEFYVEGWALCVKKSILKSIGGWSEDYGLGYWDDVDLCHRARLAGYPITPIPDIGNYIRHITNATGRDGRIDQIALHLHNRKIYLDKYYSTSPKILIDGVFFQFYNTGIARVWKSLLEEWAKSSFSQHIVVLDRGNSAPKIPGIRYRTIPLYSYNKTEADREILQQVCDEEGADLFISTYYTTPISTPSVFMAYDMIPEVLSADFNEPMWREKHNSIRHASAYISISENTALDLAKFFSGITREEVTVAHCGVSNHFLPASVAEIAQFKLKYGITKPYFLLVGAGSNYKNAGLFFKAFSLLQSKQGFDIICTGSGYTLGDEYRQFTSGCIVHPMQLSDEELRIAYSGATALVYPSLYEGFGMPVAEALACGCPVITCPNASIPEVGGEAVIYVNHNNVNDLADALCEVQKPTIRNTLIAAGLEQAKQFSWSKMADVVSEALINATLLRFNLREINFIIFPDWSQPEESLASELIQVIKVVMTHPDKDKITLLIDNSNISDEEADLALSSIVMNLMMEEELEFEESAEIALIGELSEIQWSALLPRLQGRIALEYENKEAIKQAKAENLSNFKIDSL